MISAEDARQWAPDAFNAGVRSPEPLVRRVAATSLGRVGDLRGTALLVPLLQDPDSTVQTAAAFALGLVRDTAAVGALINRLSTKPAPSVATGQEILTALAKIGGQRAADLIAAVLDNTANLANPDSRLLLVLQAAVESWRLGDAAPTRQLLALAQDANPEVRWRVMFALSQLRSPAASEAMLNGLRDDHPLVRAYAAKGLTAGYAASAQLQPDVVMQVLLRAATDEQPGVRINALRSLGTYASPAVSDRIAALLTDPTPNVQVAAVNTLGLSGRPGRRRAALAHRARGEGVVRRAARGTARPLPGEPRFVPGGGHRVGHEPPLAGAGGGGGGVEQGGARRRRRAPRLPARYRRTSRHGVAQGMARRHARSRTRRSWPPRAACWGAPTSASARSPRTRSRVRRKPRTWRPWRRPIAGPRAIR